MARSDPAASLSLRPSTCLHFCDRAVAVDVEKVLRSAVANAENNNGLRADNLVVAAAYG